MDDMQIPEVLCFGFFFYRVKVMALICARRGSLQKSGQ